MKTFREGGAIFLEKRLKRGVAFAAGNDHGEHRGGELQNELQEARIVGLKTAEFDDETGEQIKFGTDFFIFNAIPEGGGREQFACPDAQRPAVFVHKFGAKVLIKQTQFFRRGQGLADKRFQRLHAHQALVYFMEHGAIEAVAVAEVIVDGGEIDAGVGADGFAGGAGIAVFAKTFASRFNDVRAGGVAVGARLAGRFFRHARVCLFG